MNRERRYLVLKYSDIERHLSPFQRGQLAEYAAVIEIGREAAGKPPLECVVVESDWPEYEPVWKMIADRVDGVEPETLLQVTYDRNEWRNAITKFCLHFPKDVADAERQVRSRIKPVFACRPEEPEFCDWTQDQDPDYGSSWDGACGAKWVFTEDGPIENDMRYCPKCGKPLRVKKDGE